MNNSINNNDIYNIDKCNGSKYTIMEEDTLYKISRNLNIPLEKLLMANIGIDIYNLRPGQVICIPYIEDNNGDNNTNDNNNNGYDNGYNNNNNNNNGYDNGYNNGNGNSNGNSNGNNNGYGWGNGEIFIYIVKNNDTLDDVLERFDVSLEELLKYNMENGIMLKTGYALNVPRK